MSALITQADREALKVYLAERYRLAFTGYAGAHADLLLSTLAAHRIAAERETVERIVEWLRESAAWHEKHDDGLSGFGHISLGQTEAADAIEEGDWRND